MLLKKNDPVTVVGYGSGTVVKDFGHKVRVKVTVDGNTGVPVVPKADVYALPVRVCSRGDVFRPALRCDGTFSVVCPDCGCMSRKETS